MSSEQRKVAVVTGGATGIGFATVRMLAESGVDVVFGSRDERRGQVAAKALADSPGSAVFVRCDVRREAEVAGLFEVARSCFGGVDWMFNNAGVEGALALLTDAEEGAVDDLFATNVRGTIWGIKHATRLMVEQGRGGAIVNTASFVGSIVPLPVGAVYGATKSAIISLTRAAAASFGEHGIRSYAICPWMTETPMLERLTGGEDAAREQFQGINPSRQFVRPGDVARIVVDLFEQHGPYRNGDAVLVDHGGATSLISPPEVVPLAARA
ncbi:SDR family NAD(P)-dependent oxidoreductase [Vulgatibacter sp.]|uniref:SDR family NAD(P)-dependent oxidoreductase n=1 Tax=Vulgatibacter sp. TaxID=1971226 RepID=UPI0035652929